MSVFDRVFGRNLVFPCAGVEIGSGLTLTSNTTLTTDSPRYTYLNASGGAFAVTLPGSTSGVYEGYTVYLAENAGSSNAVTISAPGLQINGAASLVMSAPYRQVEIRFNGQQYIVRSGGSTFAGATLTGPGLGVQVTSGASAGLTGSSGILIRSNDYLAAVGLGNITPSATSRANVDLICLSLQDNQSYDYTLSGGVGGLITLSAPAAAGASIGGTLFFGADGSASLGGLAPTNITATLTTPSKINLGAAGGKLRIENKLGSTQTIIAMIVLGVSA